MIHQFTIINNFINHQSTISDPNPMVSPCLPACVPHVFLTFPMFWHFFHPSPAMASRLPRTMAPLSVEELEAAVTAALTAAMAEERRSGSGFNRLNGRTT